MRELVGRPCTIPVAPDRSPVLPAGIRASLAHDREFVVAALSTDPGVLAIGIDIEPATALEPGIARLVLRPDEIGLDAHRAFTMKEAAYKAWSRLGGRMLDHHDVRLSVKGSEFRAEIVAHDVGYRGRSVVAAGRWIALVVVPRTEA